MRASAPVLQRATSPLVVTLLVVMVAGCWSNRAPEPEPSPTPSVQIELRYRPISRDYCAEARLTQVLAGFGLAGPPTELWENVVSAPGNDPPSWAANCQVVASESQIDLGYFAGGGNVIVFVYGRPRYLEDYTASPPSAVAQSFFEGEQHDAYDYVSRASGDPSPAEEVVQGWWDEGVAVMATRPGVESPDNRVVDLGYVVYDDNLLIRVKLTAEYQQEVEDEAIRFTRNIAEALTERAVDHVPLAADD
jgi:hypothetical protein